MLGLHDERKIDETLIGAGCIILNGSKILIIKRTDNDTWGTPGGTVEPGEYVHDSIVREVKEETGLDIDDILYLGNVYSYDSKFSSGNVWVSHIYITRNYSGTVNLQKDECSEYKWVDIEDIWEYNLFIPCRMSLEYVDMQYPYLMQEFDTKLFEEYEGILDVVKSSDELKSYYRVTTEKLTALEQLVTVKNPGGYGGSHNGMNYQKPGSGTTGSNLPSKHEPAQEYTPEMTASQLRQDLLKWFSGRKMHVFYNVGDNNNFIFPTYEKMKTDKIVTTPQNYENLFKEQYILYQLANMEKITEEELQPEEPETESQEAFVEVSKLDKMKRLVYGKVLVPNKVDLQGDYISPDEVEKTAHEFLINLQVAYTQLKMGNILEKDASQIGVMHTKFKGVGGFGYIAESYIDPQDKSWMLVTKITDEEIWKQILDGVITGYSIGGKTLRIPRGEVKFDAQDS